MNNDSVQPQNFNQSSNNYNGNFNSLQNSNSNQNGNNELNNVINSQNKFIQEPTANNNNIINNQKINQSIANDTKNKYQNDPKVIENLNQIQKKKNSIPISKELMQVIKLSLVLLIFIFLIPIIFDLFRK